ncbi:unnamed protein product [Cyprideis torosa]|uniref:Short-chain dehydrogenase/reductase 3 n=1 Tax=Cyprideis torosa TaxID=163714 RepID=A0A7R8W0L8_9CRUS|nr:unnamed protein product [Cyprideis torosa]CAG0879895.1 unnamed protein product [Cyprideis torosa]
MFSFIVNFIQEIFLCFGSIAWGVVRFFTPNSLVFRSLQGSVAVVTGAGSGIGRLMALRLALEEGCEVMCCDIDSAGCEATVASILEKGGKGQSFKVDVTQRGKVYEIAERIKAEIGDKEVTILINNAGIVAGGELLNVDDTKIRQIMEVNALSHFWTIKAFLPGMIQAGDGHIVTIASAGGLVVASSHIVPYYCSKFAAVGLDEALAFELEFTNKSFIRTTVICPYFIDTGMFEGAHSPVLPISTPDYVANRTIDAVKASEEWVMIPSYTRLAVLLKILTTSTPTNHCSDRGEKMDVAGTRSPYDNRQNPSRGPVTYPGGRKKRQWTPSAQHSEILRDDNSFKVDVTQRDKVYEIAGRIKAEIGDKEVTILINNAGIVAGGELLNVDDTKIQQMMEVNALSHFWTIKAFLPGMIHAGDGHIVSIASVAGLAVGSSHMVPYYCSKFAVVGLDEALAFELEFTNKSFIRTTVICPYFIDTGMFEGVRSPLVPILTPDYVANRTIDAVKASEDWVVIPSYSRLAVPFLQLLKESDHHQLDPVHVVMGNEACDLDSSVSALVYAFFLSQDSNGSPVVPVLNVLRSELHLRTEVVFWLEKNDVPIHLCPCRDEISLPTLQGWDLLRLHLVDHHVLPAWQRNLEPAVVEILDHHPIAPSAPPPPSFAKIELVGSCSSLVTREIMQSATPSILTPQLARLLIGPIVLDTANFSVTAGKATSVDVAFSTALKLILDAETGSETDLATFMDQLNAARRDLSSLTPEEVLCKDRKVLSCAEGEVAISALPVLAEPWVTSSNEAYVAVCTCPFQVTLVMGYHVGSHDTIERDLLIGGGNERLRQMISTALESSPLLSLSEGRRLPHPPVAGAGSPLVAYSQGNPSASRKQVLPLVLGILSPRRVGSLSPSAMANGRGTAEDGHRHVPNPYEPYCRNGLHVEKVAQAMQLLGIDPTPASLASSSQASSSQNSCPYTPLNSVAEEGSGSEWENSGADAGGMLLPSFNNRDIVERIRRKRGAAELDAASYPFTPKNSYVEPSTLDEAFAMQGRQEMVLRGVREALLQADSSEG